MKYAQTFTLFSFCIIKLNNLHLYYYNYQYDLYSLKIPYIFIMIYNIVLKIQNLQIAENNCKIKKLNGVLDRTILFIFSSLYIITIIWKHTKYTYKILLSEILNFSSFQIDGYYLGVKVLVDNNLISLKVCNGGFKRYNDFYSFQLWCWKGLLRII